MRFFQKICFSLCLFVPFGSAVMAKTETALFAGGCFWCMQPPYDNLPGVLKTEVGYAGGHTENPTYEDVSTGRTGHLEVVQITFDPDKLSYDALLSVFWKNIDPSQANGQFADVGSQYETAIFYYSSEQKKSAETSKKALEKTKKFPRVATRIIPAETFYPAEEAHQTFYKKNPLRYQSYKMGSGRQRFIETNWKKP